MTDNYINATLAGTVGRTGSAKNGPYAMVEIARNGSQYPDRVTVWGMTATTGDAVEVRGKLSWKKTERDGKTYVDVSLNDHETITQDPGPSDPHNDSTPF